MNEATVLEVEPTSGPPEEEPLYEIVNGQRVELPPMGAYETLLASMLARHLAPFVDDQQLGLCVTEMLFDIGLADRSIRPDAAYVSFARWPRERRVPSAVAWEVVPDLAVEVVSKTDRANDLLARVRDYFQAGVVRVWVIFPSESLVYIYASPRQIRVLGREETLDGGELIPGFRLPLTVLFREEVGPAA